MSDSNDVRRGKESLSDKKNKSDNGSPYQQPEMPRVSEREEEEEEEGV